MSQSLNWYKADLRELNFLLFEQFRLQELLGNGLFSDWSREDVEVVLDEMYKWTCEVLGPLNTSGDQQGCTLENGKVITPDGFPEAWRSLYKAGWRQLAVSEEEGGQQGPFTVYNIAEEMMSGANVSFNMYSGLTHGACELISTFGTKEQLERYCPRMHSGTFGGTMCLTEPQAGTDVGSSTTKAIRLDDGTYKLEGTKIYISGGDHDLADNIIHLVLARTEGAPTGTKGLSLFIVPRDRLDGSGNNDVAVTGIEHKMGIRGSSTCVLQFGDQGNCIGELLGTEEQQGMRMMFRLMNFARIAVGTMGVGVASSAYLNALAYAKERKQGASIKEWKNPNAERVPIIEHPDVRRMLLDMKARVEGIRALVVKLTMHIDRIRLLGDNEPETVAYHQGQVDLLVPLVKAYGSDQAYDVCTTAVQVLGGAGFLQDHPLEQYVRDSKIFSIYEGTNHIQALDLVGRKLGQKGGTNFRAFLKDINDFVSSHREHAVFGESVQALGAAANTLGAGAMKFLQWSTGGKLEMVPREANRFLEMMSETAIAWLLLKGGLIAHEAGEKLADDHVDKNFYQGRVYSALYFGRNVLPDVVHKASKLNSEDRSVFDIPEAAFATL